MSGTRFPREFAGRIEAALPERSGAAQGGGLWRVREYVMCDGDDRYPQRIVFSVYGERIEQFGLVPGEEVTVCVDFGARQSPDGRWYNGLRAYRVSRPGNGGTAGAAPGGAPAPAPAMAAAQAAPVQAAPGQGGAAWPQPGQPWARGSQVAPPERGRLYGNR